MSGEIFQKSLAAGGILPIIVRWRVALNLPPSPAGSRCADNLPKPCSPQLSEGPRGKSLLRVIGVVRNHGAHFRYYPVSDP
jgi:hypothetical protein